MPDKQLRELAKVGLEISDCIFTEKDKVVGWLCSYVPEEIIHAAGFHSMRISGKGNPIRKADALLHNNICPFVRNVMDDAVSGDLNHLSGIVFANSCDAMRRLYDAWSVFLKNDTIFYLDPPKGKTDLAVVHYADQLRSLALSLNRHSPKEITTSSLNNSIKVFNQTRALIKDVSRLASNNFISGYTAFNIMQMATRCDREKFNQRLEQFLDQFSSRQLSKKGVRILLTGCIIDQSDQIMLMEDAGARVIVNELCNGSRQFDHMVLETEDPFQALAERYLKKAPCSRMLDIKGRTDYLLQLANKNNVDGIIYYIVKFCDQYMWDLPVVRDAFEKKGIPVLDVEGDYIRGSFGALQTRIEAFVESLQD